MIKSLNRCGIIVQNSILNADKGFSKKLRRACRRRNIEPNIKENRRNRKNTKQGRKRFFDENMYKRRFVNERAFAWMDSFRTLLVRFDKLDESWLNWKKKIVIRNQVQPALLFQNLFYICRAKKSK